MKVSLKQIPILIIILAPFFILKSAFGVELSILPRSPNSLTGTEFKNLITSLSLSDREKAIYSQVAVGNIPNFMRTLVPVTVTKNIDGQNHTATYYVIADYLAIGSDADYFLMPMTPLIAQHIANLLGCGLPTAIMVDNIWSSAEVKLAPAPISPSPEMITVPVFAQHNTMVWNQRSAYLATNPLGDLVGGDKKDVVITNLIYTKPPPPRVAIYGWHQLNGTPIQPLSCVHEETYADYSHGIRLVALNMLVDEATKTIPQILSDSDLCVLLSNEGMIAKPYYTVSSPPEIFQLIDSFPSTGRQLTSWVNKFTQPTITSFSPCSPGGDGYVLIVKDPAGGMETTRIGNVTDVDYYVECDIYCNYCPDLSSDGYERVGIFARDNENGAFEHTSGGGGYCYVLAWDSSDGRLWCMKSQNGAKTDLNLSPMYRPSSGWRKMRIEVYGNQITFKIDGDTILETTDDTYRSGQCGIGYHEYFTTNSNMIGTIADNFKADLISPTPSPTPTPTPRANCKIFF